MSAAQGFSARTKARKRATDIVFEAQQRGLTRSADQMRALLDERQLVSATDAQLPPFAAALVAGVADNLRQIDQLLTKHSRVPGLDRLPGVDLAVMRVAVWEMLDPESDVDAIVSIDEAVSIVKSLSTDQSPAFVNAVLDAIRKDLAGQEGDVAAELPAVPKRGAGSPAAADGKTELLEQYADELDELLDEY